MQFFWLPTINAIMSILEAMFYLVMIIAALKLIKALDKYNGK